jgi:hypothetical protein
MRDGHNAPMRRSPRRAAAGSMPNGWCVCFAVTTLVFIDGRGAQAGDTNLPTGSPVRPRFIRLIIDRNRYMKFLGYAYRFLSNFVFMAMVYYSLNSMEKYQQRAVLAILVLAYAVMRAATALRSFYFFQRIERLELEARRLAGLTGDGPASAASRKQIVNDVAVLRRDGEMKSYIDLLFLALVVLLCVSKIVTD